MFYSFPNRRIFSRTIKHNRIQYPLRWPHIKLNQVIPIAILIASLSRHHVFIYTTETVMVQDRSSLFIEKEVLLVPSLILRILATL